MSYSKAFVKAVDKLSGKILLSVRDAIQEVIPASGRRIIRFPFLLLISSHTLRA